MEAVEDGTRLRGSSARRGWSGAVARLFARWLVRHERPPQRLCERHGRRGGRATPDGGRSSRNRQWTLALVALLVAATAGGLLAAAYPAGQPERSPVDPEFAAFMRQVLTGRVPEETGEGGRALGYIPGPVDLSHTAGRASLAPSRLSLLPSYDLRGTGRLSPVRDQGDCGSCWAFGTYSALESWFLTQVPAVAKDFSENNLKECHGFDWGPCDGGNTWISAAYLARGGGPIPESDDPYVDYADPYGCSPGILACPNPESRPVLGSVAQPVVDTYIRDVLFISGVDKGSDPAPDYLKQAIVTHGAVATSMRWEALSYSSDHFAYYYGQAKPSNHAVALVGWNDAFDRNLFPTVPAGDGAWIVRNSWGSDFGDGGYFYISYYDSVVATRNTVFINAQSPEGLVIYQYDPLGWFNEWRMVNDNVDWGANVFTAEVGGRLTGVGFYTTDVDTTYEIDIRSGAPWGSSRLATAVSGTCGWPGYHVVNLPTPVSISYGEVFAIVVKLANPSYPYTMAAEAYYAGYSSAATASPGQSYLSNTGSSNEGDWWDLTNGDPTSNFCIKGLFTDQPTPAVFRVTETGRVRADGRFYGSRYLTEAADVAEWVPVGEPVEPGDILELDPSSPGSYRRASVPCSSLVAGVVSTQAGIVLGGDLATAGRALLALVGIVPVKVTDEGGPIQPGDLVVVSSRAGFGMRGDPARVGPACGIVGKALEAHAAGQGVILVLLTAH